MQVNEYFIHLPMKMELTVSSETSAIRTQTPMKMETTVSSETSAIRTQTPGNYPKRNKLHLEHGESLKTSMICFLTAIELTPGVSSTVHIYIQTIHRTRK